jgi:hypothetical protein
MERDPRLRSLLHDGGSQGATLIGGNLENREQTREQISDAWESAARQESTKESTAQYEGASQYKEAEPKSQSASTQPSWTSYRSPTTPSQPQQRSDSWDSSITDDLDDASPVASSSKNNSDASRYSGSAWDRVRQQSQYHPSGQPDRKSWEKPQSGGGWGSETDSNAQYQRQHSQDNYSFSSADEEKNLAKGQAQAEFDRLLERERGDPGQEKNSWSRK